MSLNPQQVALAAGVVVVSLFLGGVVGYGVRVPAPSTEAGPVGRDVLYYQSPMHPWVTSDHPGNCTVCGMKLVAVHAGDAPRKARSDGVVMLSRESVQTVGVETSTVRRQPLKRSLKISGTYAEEESRHGVISAPVEGKIEGLAMSCEGQVIRRHQPLVTLFSKTLLGAAESYKEAAAAGGSGEEIARRRLIQLGLSEEQIRMIPQRQADDRYFGLLAPLTGTITRSYVAEGQYVKEGDRLFEIADFTRMWFLFTVYEPDLPLVQVGQWVTLNAPSAPGQTVRARIAFISPNLDEATRSTIVRVVVENPGGRLHNKMSATGFVELAAPEVLGIPRTAVLRTGSNARVYVEQAPGVYEARVVQLGRTGDGTWEVVSGLTEGEKVVVNGNLLMDAQAQLQQVANNP